MNFKLQFTSLLIIMFNGIYSRIMEYVSSLQSKAKREHRVKFCNLQDTMMTMMMLMGKKCFYFRLKIILSSFIINKLLLFAKIYN